MPPAEPESIFEVAKRTLVFCTAFARTADVWDYRYRTWLDAILGSELQFERILLVDDGSPTLPNWSDVAIVHENSAPPDDAGIVLYHFSDHLGRVSDFDFPGWYRSFAYAGRYAQRNGYRKVVHIESDAFLISRRIRAYLNAIRNGWIATWCPRHNFPESGIQVIAGQAMSALAEVCERPNSHFVTGNIEHQLPFTHVEKAFKGDRYSEGQFFIPRDADYSTQTPLLPRKRQLHLWWLEKPSDDWSGDIASIYMTDTGHTDLLTHKGVYYLTFLKACNDILKPRNYLEIGTDEGHSLIAFECDAVCIDPSFSISTNVLNNRERTFFFRQDSDQFFAETNLLNLLGQPIDFAFLDGLHLCESLLRDFINVERNCHRRSVIVLHDCLPLNERMSERKQRLDETEDPSIQDFWTGDIWKVLPILKKYRPDLSVLYVDCPPTGLVLCTNLDPKSDVIQLHYDEIVEEMAQLNLSELGLRAIWDLFPTLDSAMLLQNPLDFAALFATA
jgi:hypothetical protein